MEIYWSVFILKMLDLNIFSLYFVWLDGKKVDEMQYFRKSLVFLLRNIV